MLTKDQATAIRILVDKSGWNAVREDKTLGPIWKRQLEEQKRHRNSIIEPSNHCPLSFR